MSDTSPTQVFIVTCDCYSSYGISSVYLTLEEAEAAVAGSDDSGGYGCRVEVYPIGNHKRTLGSFCHVCELHPTTGAILTERIDDVGSADIDRDSRVQIMYVGSSPMRAEPYLLIRAYADTPERAGKIYSETKAMVLHELTIGIPAQVIGYKEYVDGQWRVDPRVDRHLVEPWYGAAT